MRPFSAENLDRVRSEGIMTLSMMASVGSSYGRGSDALFPFEGGTGFFPCEDFFVAVNPDDVRKGGAGHAVFPGVCG